MIGGPAADLCSDVVLRVSEVPHDWLFPRVAAVVHDGGAGTSAAVLRAGKPSVVVPFFADQPFWASRIRALGAGPPPIPCTRLTEERLATALRAATEHIGLQQRAAQVGAGIRREDGVGAACQTVECWLVKASRWGTGPP